MKIKFSTSFLIISIIFFLACTSKKERHFIVGSWQTSYLKITIPSAYHRDSVQVYEEDFSKAKAIKAQSTYKDNGTFIAWYLNEDGTKTSQTKGKWKVKQDSLYVEYIFKEKLVKPSYFIQQIPNGFKAISKYDWNNDGKKDDLLEMKVKKITIK